MVDRRLNPEQRSGADADSGPGVLFSSGLIAGGAITGVILAGFTAKGLDEKIDLSKSVGAMATSATGAMLFYVVLLAIPLYLVARRMRAPIG